MTKEERVAHRKSVRQSKRMTVEMQANESRSKVEQQIGNFMQMLTTLEGEWQRQEETRFQKEKELNEVKEHLTKVGEQMVAVGKVLSDTSAQMDHLKNILDKIVTNASPKVRKADEKWFGDFEAFQQNFWQMRHTMYIQQAKNNKVRWSILHARYI